MKEKIHVCLSWQRLCIMTTGGLYMYHQIWHKIYDSRMISCIKICIIDQQKARTIHAVFIIQPTALSADCSFNRLLFPPTALSTDSSFSDTGGRSNSKSELYLLGPSMKSEFEWLWKDIYRKVTNTTPTGGIG